MLVNMKKMLYDAQQGRYAVPHFNINNLEWTRYILEAGEEKRSPIIIGVSESAVKYMGGYKTVYNIVTGLISDLNITVPVALHLDHGKSVESCKEAIDAGFTSVMLDYSAHPLDDNIKSTSELVSYGHPRDVTIEAEVGHISTFGVTVDDMAYANLEDCVKLVNETNVDFLAPALGSVHGLYKGKAKIDIERMSAIRDAVKIPLVLHGGTGVPDETIVRAIGAGICKININTDLQVVWAKAVRAFLIADTAVYDPRKIIGSGETAIKSAVREKIMLFGSNNKIK